jgi:hypothetical protein
MSNLSKAALPAQYKSFYGNRLYKNSTTKVRAPDDNYALLLYNNIYKKTLDNKANYDKEITKRKY